MKGPFKSYADAFTAANSGEHVLARNSARYRNEGWCVMSESEWNSIYRAYLNAWVHWEKVV